MDNEIESLWLSLGIKPDDSSASDAVDKITKTVQSKLKSSIYGGEKGVITLPATIEGKFKNGREIDKSITDAYAAIYKKAKQMADESVSLTLKDIEDFKAQIDKFGKKTAKYRGSDVIANANNNLRQILSDYQDFINGLKNETAKIQRTQTKQAQKVKAQQKAKTKKASYHGITDEEIDDAIAKENARQAKIKAWRDEQAEQLASKLGYKSSSGPDPSKTSNYAMNASEFSEYESQWARELAKTIKETYKTTVDKQWIDKEYKPADGKGRATTREEHLNYLSNAAFKDLADLIAKAEKGDESVTFDKIVEAIGVMRTIYEENGKDMNTIAKAVINATQSRYGDNPKRKNGGINREEGAEKGVGKGHEQVKAYQSSISQLLKKMLGEVTDIKEKENEATKAAVKMTNAYEQAKTDAKNSKASFDTKQLAQELKNSDTTKSELNKLNTSVNDVKSEVKAGTKATNTQTTYDKMDNVKKDTDAAKEIKIEQQNADINRDTAGAVKRDETTGFNTDSKADELIKSIGKGETVDLSDDITSMLQEILSQITVIAGNTAPKETKKYKVSKKNEQVENNNDYSFEIQSAYKELEEVGKLLPIVLKPVPESVKVLYEQIGLSTKSSKYQIGSSKETPKAVSKTEFDKISTKLAEGEKPRKSIEKSNIYASPIKTTLRDVFENFLNDLTGASTEYKKIMNASTEQQDKMTAERVKIWGMNNGRNPNDTGDIASMRRILELYRNNKASIEQNPELMQKIKLTDGIKIDTTEITKVFNEALSGKQMRNAQMGGSPIQQLLGLMRGFIFMPSIEKSRAQADGLNQILGIINKSLNSLLSNIQMYETTLAGMEKTGEVKFDDQGYMIKGSSAAKKTLADLEESKYVLEMLQADLLANEAIVKRTSGNYGQMIKQLSFASPMLRDCNGILRNMNAGLDKNGKALKFQTRMAEILNYTFQLMGRSIGQMIKSWMVMLNPVNLIKRAFQDFASYDVKWQRTMNVIKYNIRAILKPFMQWLAQSIVNVIGFIDIISQKIQKAFGRVPVSLFDQVAADMEKTNEEIQNVTAGFDELHDIGSDNTGANDLLGEIYKPQLSKEWEDFANNIGDFIAGIIPGIQGVFDYIVENWQQVLQTVLSIFLAWKLLKIAGPILLQALFGGLTKGNIGEIFSKIGNSIGKLFGKELYTTATGQAVTAGKLIGGVLLTAIGTVISATSTHNLVKYWDAIGIGEKVLSGIGVAGGIATSALGGFLIGGPIGAGIAAATTAIIDLGVAMTTSRDKILSLEEATEQHNNALAYQSQVVDKLATATLNASMLMSNLEEIEKQTGISGADLAKQIKDGTLKVEDMTSAQLKVYSAYLKNQQAIEELTRWQEEKVKADKAVIKSDIETMLINAKTSGSYDELAEHIDQMVQDEKISLDEAKTYHARIMAEMTDEQRKTYKEKLPTEQQEGLDKQIEQYETFGRRVSDFFINLFSGIGEFISGFFSNVLNFGQSIGNFFSKGQFATDAEIIKKVAHMSVGTNYVPNDGLAYLHQGEAVIPAKYNKPFMMNNSNLEDAIYNLTRQVEQIGSKVDQGINVKVQFVQRGSDLVATVEKASSKLSNNILNNKVYAR